jgi:hypothetical protein
MSFQTVKTRVFLGEFDPFRQMPLAGGGGGAVKTYLISTLFLPSPIFSLDRMPMMRLGNFPQNGHFLKNPVFFKNAI